MSHNNNKYSLFRALASIGAGILGCGVLFLSSSVIEHTLSYVVYPVLHAQCVCVDAVNSWIRDRKENAQLKSTCTLLHEECETLRADNIQLRAAQKYTDDIEEVHAFRKQYTVDVSRITRILFRHFSAKEHYFLVDAGFNQGIKQDMVAVYKSCLIGRVEHVYSWYSKVRLITDVSCKVAAYCADTKCNGIYQGDNEQGSALLQYVSHFQPIKLNDAVLSSGEGMIFPQGFSLGSVESCEKTGLYHTIRVKPHVDLQALAYCVLVNR